MEKVYIDAETADGIVIASLRESIKNLQSDIKDLKRKKKLESHEKEDLADMVISLNALEIAYNYYGGNL